MKTMVLRRTVPHDATGTLLESVTNITNPATSFLSPQALLSLLRSTHIASKTPIERWSN